MSKKGRKKDSAIVTKESICSTCALFSFLAFLILCTKSLIFGEIGETVHIFFTGVFGYCAYPLLLGAIYLSLTGLFGKRFVRNRKLGVCVGMTLLFVALIVHTATTLTWDLNGYLKKCFVAGSNFPKTTVCGVLGGLLVFGLSSLVSQIGAIVIFSLLTLLCGYFCYLAGRKKGEKKIKEEETPQEQPAQTTQPVQPVSQPAPQPQQPAPIYQQPIYGGQATDGYAMPTVTQRPGVSLGDNEPAKPQTPLQSFSPFGVPQGGYTQQPSTQSPTQPYNSRDILFGGTPAENFQKNLLFDPNSRVNQRPAASPVQPTVQSTYTPSYTSAFENSVNKNGEQPRPAKIVSDRSYSSAYSREEETTAPPVTPPIQPITSPVQPTPPVVEPPVFRREEPVPPTVVPPNTERFDRETLDSSREEISTHPARGEEQTEEPTYRRHDYMDIFSPSNPNVFGNDETQARYGREFADRIVERETPSSEQPPVEEPIKRDGFHLLDDEEEEDDPYTLRSDFTSSRGASRTAAEGSSRDAELFDSSRRFDEPTTERTYTPPVEPVKEVEPPKQQPPKPRIIRPYVRVPLDDFDCRDVQPTANEEEVAFTKENIIATLEEFKITGASIASVTFGPTVTRYNVTIPRSISPKKVVALDQSIAMNLHSNGVNVYPNYEDGVVSIEVPNKDRQFVQLGCMLSGDTFVNAKSSSLMFAMGKDVANRKVYGDISKMIHLLVAGSSGSGKSVFLGALIISLIYKYSPEELRLILIDPKKTEFVLYNNLPHLMINEIITDAGKVVQSLNWAIMEMERRYSLFEKMSRSGTYVVNLDQYNEQLDKAERLPKIVIIIDELADLMLVAKKELEDRIQSLTQKARAAGIHLIVATQRPSTDVITGVIKSNLATRVGFYVASDVDSRVILDQTGAQKLLGKGDFLYTMPGINVPVRVQSAFISAEESQRIVNFIKNNNEAYYDEEATAFINSRGGNGGGSADGGNDGAVDPMYIEALRYVIQSNSASISMIQRKCSAGYNRAGKIIEWMEDMGYISPFDGAKARKVLITQEIFESKYGPL